MVFERESRFMKVGKRIILRLDLVHCPQSQPETEGESWRRFVDSFQFLLTICSW